MPIAKRSLEHTNERVGEAENMVWSGCAGPYIADLYGIDLGLQHQGSISWYIHVRLLSLPGITIQWLVKMKTKDRWLVNKPITTWVKLSVWWKFLFGCVQI